MIFSNYREIFRHRAFASFWGGFTLSALGDAMTRVALTWYVYETTKSPAALGWLMVCYTGPVIIGGLAAGPLLDRFDRRAVMVIDNVIRGAAVAIIPLLHVTGHLALWHVYTVAAVYGLLMMISLAGVPSLIPSLVRGDQLSTANALETLSYMISGVVGPVIAGVLIPKIGAPQVVTIDAVSYFAFALALSRMPSVSEPRRAKADAHAYSMADAVHLLLTNKILLTTTAMFMAFNIGGGFLSVWLPILADKTLNGGSELYGFLLGAMAVGEMASAFLAGSVAFPLSLGALICLAQMLTGVSLVPLLISSNVWLIAPGLALFGAFSSPLTIWAQTLRMQIIPDRLRGRAFALLRTLMQSGGPLGGGIGGWLLPALGIPAMITLSAILIGVPGAIGYQVKELRMAGSIEG